MIDCRLQECKLRREWLVLIVSCEENNSGFIVGKAIVGLGRVRVADENEDCNKEETHSKVGNLGG